MYTHIYSLCTHIVHPASVHTYILPVYTHIYSLCTAGDEDVLEADILLRPEELEVLKQGGNPVGASIRKEDKELHVDGQGVHSR